LLTLPIIESLINSCPLEAEISLYAHPEDLDTSVLSAPDLFFVEVTQIPNYSDRLVALKWYLTHNEYYNETIAKVI
jgi:hypothetical protein